MMAIIKRKYTNFIIAYLKAKIITDEMTKSLYAWHYLGSLKYAVFSRITSQNLQPCT